jgi:hypothetical protein
MSVAIYGECRMSFGLSISSSCSRCHLFTCQEHVATCKAKSCAECMLSNAKRLAKSIDCQPSGPFHELRTERVLIRCKVAEEVDCALLARAVGMTIIISLSRTSLVVHQTMIRHCCGGQAQRDTLATQRGEHPAVLALLTLSVSAHRGSPALTLVTLVNSAYIRSSFIFSRTKLLTPPRSAFTVVILLSQLTKLDTPVPSTRSLSVLPYGFCIFLPRTMFLIPLA